MNNNYEKFMQHKKKIHGIDNNKKNPENFENKIVIHKILWYNVIRLSLEDKK